MDGYRIGKTLNLNPQVHVHHTWRAPCPNKGNTARQAARSIATPENIVHWRLAWAPSTDFLYHKMLILQKSVPPTLLFCPTKVLPGKDILPPIHVGGSRIFGSTYSAGLWSNWHVQQLHSGTNHAWLSCAWLSLLNFAATEKTTCLSCSSILTKKTYSTHTSFFHLIYLEMFEE